MINPLAAARRTPHRTWVRYRFVFFALAPIMALFIYLRVIPTGQAILMSLFDWELVAPAKNFVGLDNYLNLLGDDNFRLAFTNTTIFAIATTLISVLSPCGSPRSCRAPCGAGWAERSSCSTSRRSSCRWCR